MEMSWQPIETAPRDERLLVFDGDFVTGGVYVTYDSMGWCLDHGDDTQPTHWAPLPKGPKP